MSISVEKWTFCFVSLCFQNHHLLALDFLQLSCWDRLELFSILYPLQLLHSEFSSLVASELSSLGSFLSGAELL